MLKAIAGRRWVIRHGLRLAVMKCAESSEIRHDFTDIVFTGLAKGMSEGLKFGIEHEKAGHELSDVEAYDLQANNKLVKALQDLKDLKYLILCDIRLSSFQLKIPIYPEVRDPKDPWVIKEEVLSDGISVSVPTVAPQGLAILVADAAIQTEIYEDEASPRLLRSKSVPLIYNLDWP
ncbi:hypothetical protein Tco_0322168 [Tanacetum coccineum]